MKKTLIAGAASLALAAMPVVGAFALTDPSPVEDTLTVTVAESCAFSRTTGSGDYQQTMLADRLNDNFGQSVFTSECNNGLGYTISAVFTALEHADGPSAGASITYSAQDPTAGSGTWTAAALGGNLAASGGQLANTNSQDPGAGSTYTVTYKVSTHTTQAAGTYSGTATYTLAQKS